MARTCTICTHTERDAIDAALVNNTSYRSITERYNVSAGAIARHKQEHIPSTLTRAQDAEEVAHADNLLDQVKKLTERTERLYLITEGILGKAYKADDLATVLKAIREASNINREARGNLELLAKLMGQLNEGAVVNVLVNPEWHMVRTVIVQALSPFPEARLAVAEALQEVDRVA